jgi:hypothetical protein
MSNASTIPNTYSKASTIAQDDTKFNLMRSENGAMTSSATMTIPATTISTSIRLTGMRTKPKWPHVDDSLGHPCESLGIFKTRTWLAKGAAKDAYLEICHIIKDLLEQRDDWQQGGCKEMPSGFDCFMTGRDRADARPTIIVHCRYLAACKRAIEIIKDAEAWRLFERKYPAFQLKPSNRPPRPLAFVPGTRSPPTKYSKGSVVWAATTISTTTRIQIRHRLDEGTKTTLSSEATAGGHALLNGKLCALTVAHAENPGLDTFEDQPVDPPDAEIFWDSDGEEREMDEDEGWHHLEAGKIRHT